MREIKFRAWDDQLKTMLEDVVYMNTGHGYGKYSVVLPFKSENYFKAYGQRGWEIDDAGNAYKHNLKVMQYTGLKDKNGTEIYESDLVRDIESGSIGKVEYDAPEFIALEVKKENDGFCCNLLFGGSVEVIGNIYENPELLSAGIGEK